jgi:hypothetical protein
MGIDTDAQNRYWQNELRCPTGSSRLATGTAIAAMACSGSIPKATEKAVAKNGSGVRVDP